MLGCGKQHLYSIIISQEHKTKYCIRIQKSIKNIIHNNKSKKVKGLIRLIVLLEYSDNGLNPFATFLADLAKDYFITLDHDNIEKADTVIIYSSQTHEDLSLYLTQHNLFNRLKQHANAGKSILGISSGMDMLLSGVFDRNYYQGLNLIYGYARYDHTKQDYPTKNWVMFQKPHPLLKNIENGYAYITNKVEITQNNPEDILAVYQEDEESIPEIAMIAHENIIGMRWRPDLSSELGISSIKQFLESKL